MQSPHKGSRRRREFNQAPYLINKCDCYCYRLIIVSPKVSRATFLSKQRRRRRRKYTHTGTPFIYWGDSVAPVYYVAEEERVVTRREEVLSHSDRSWFINGS